MDCPRNALTNSSAWFVAAESDPEKPLNQLLLYISFNGKRHQSIVGKLPAPTSRPSSRCARFSIQLFDTSNFMPSRSSLHHRSKKPLIVIQSFQSNSDGY